MVRKRSSRPLKATASCMADDDHRLTLEMLLRPLGDGGRGKTERDALKTPRGRTVLLKKAVATEAAAAANQGQNEQKRRKKLGTVGDGQ
jgi:hypothetical protein